VSALGGIPPELTAALGASQSMTPQAQGNPTGGSSQPFQDQLKKAIDDLQAALPLAPDAPTAQLVQSCLVRLQHAQSPGIVAGLSALGNLTSLT
jgi:hypothetical protein